jgi:hypothetical protein
MREKNNLFNIFMSFARGGRGFLPIGQGQSQPPSASKPAAASRYFGGFMLN